MNNIKLANDWNDYTLLDAGGGEKLEKWGNVTVIRPDPQAFWQKSFKWEKPDMHYHRSKSGGGAWEILNKNKPDAWKISYEELRFHIRPTGFKHMGLFPEQAVNWKWISEILKRANKNDAPKVLNLFAYTGGATLACLKAGAEVTHVDAAKGMNNWARDNINLSGLSNCKCKIITDDVLKFVNREARRGNMYDGIIMDPPVFGRGPCGEMWKLEDGLYELVKSCVRILSQSPLFFLINGYSGFSPIVYGNILKPAMKNYSGEVKAGEVGIPAKSGVILPCGMYARWAAN